MARGILIQPSFYEAMKVLPDSDRLLLYDTICEYSLNGVEPTSLPPIANSLFILMKPNIDSSNNRYSASVENGKKGGAPKGNQNARKKQPKNNQSIQPTGKQDFDFELDCKGMCSAAIELLNNLSGGSFRATTQSTQNLIAARMKEGYSWADIETVIRHKCAVWGENEKMRQYLRPETLFGSKFEAYLSDARRNNPKQEQGYMLAPLEDPFDVIMGGGGNV